MRTIFKAFSVCCILYCGAFFAVHSFPALRRPAANLSYWYYSDNDALEAIEFYGFWPLRQLGYGLDVMSRHNDDRIYPPVERPFTEL